MKLVIKARKYHMTCHSYVPEAETLETRAGCCQFDSLRKLKGRFEAL